MWYNNAFSTLATPSLTGGFNNGQSSTDSEDLNSVYIGVPIAAVVGVAAGTLAALLFHRRMKKWNKNGNKHTRQAVNS